jgi:hypothetical protein
VRLSAASKRFPRVNAWPGSKRVHFRSGSRRDLGEKQEEDLADRDSRTIGGAFGAEGSMSGGVFLRRGDDLVEMVEMPYELEGHL